MKYLYKFIFALIITCSAITLGGRGGGGHFGGGGFHAGGTRSGGYGRGVGVGSRRVGVTHATTTRAGRVGKVSGAKKVRVTSRQAHGQKITKAGKSKVGRHIGTSKYAQKVKKGGKGAADRGGAGRRDRHHGRGDHRHRSNICPGCRHPIFYEPGWWVAWYPWLTIPWVLAATQPSQQTIIVQETEAQGTEEAESSRKAQQQAGQIQQAPSGQQEYLHVIYKDTKGNLLTEQFVSPEQQETMFIYDPTDHTLIERRELDLHGNQTIQKAAQGPIAHDEPRMIGPVKVIERTVDIKTHDVVKSAQHYEYAGTQTEQLKTGQFIVPARESEVAA